MDTDPTALVNRVREALPFASEEDMPKEPPLWARHPEPLASPQTMIGSERSLLFLLFFVSGFSGLAYQIIWTRMAFAAFGILTPVLSVVISVFMLGLSVGSWAGGRTIEKLTRQTGWPALRFYALAEMAISAGAFAVPKLFAAGKGWLLSTGQSDSFAYLALSALVLALSILPWCVCMGTTFPWMMAHLRSNKPAHESAHSFSYLYLANVLGAMSGSLIAAFVLIELCGFRDTLRVAALGNLFVALMALRLSWRAENPGTRQTSVLREGKREQTSETQPDVTTATAAPILQSGRAVKWILFTTGFVSMAMEVVWTRAFAPVIKSQVYSFALVLAGYLAATFFGSRLYRRDLQRNRTFSPELLLGLLSVAVFLPVLANQKPFIGGAWGFSTLDLRYAGLLVGSLCPFCAILGYLSPSLVDRYSGGCPARAGSAYAINVLGCILGPLFASYLVLSHLGERQALLLLALPLIICFVLLSRKLARNQMLGFGLALAAVLVAALGFPDTYEDYIRKLMPPMQVRRDHAATVISCGKNFERALLVNGFGMTALANEPKFMVHYPMALHRGQPKSALIICFGMGTSFRSALSWGARTTAVELSPSVRDAFSFYHADAAQVLQDPNGRIVVDDGRRYLERSRDTYDVIVIDPPPPVEAAGSSLLYSKEFYHAAKRRLNPGGILQAWIPERDTPVFAAALRTLCESFPHVQCIVPLGNFGIHMLASREPIEICTPQQMVSRMPERAKVDLVEWMTLDQISTYLAKALTTQTAGQNLLNSNFNIQITDDRPYNEYFLLRQLGWL